MAYGTIALDNSSEEKEQLLSDESRQLSKRQAGEQVRVLSFHRGLWTKPTTESFLRYNFTGGRVNLLTVCYWIRYERFVKLNTHLSYTNLENNFDSFGAYHEDVKLMTVVASNTLTDEDSNDFWNVSPETWVNLCHLLGNSSYSIFWNGKKFFQTSLSSDWTLTLNGSLVLGQEQDTLGGDFDPDQVLVGDIAHLTFWDFLLTPGEVWDFANCENIGKRNIFNSNDAVFENFGITEEWQDLATICRSSRKYFIILPEERNFHDSFKMCNLLNATMAVPTNPTENQLLTQDALLFQDICVPGKLSKIWIGLTDEREESVWRDATTNEVATYLNFVHSIPPVSSSSNCAVLTTKGYYNEGNCAIHSKSCTACQLERQKVLFLRGLCFDTEHKSRFRVDGYHNDRPAFVGFYDLAILWDNVTGKWQLTNIMERKTYLRMRESSLLQYPLGRNKWLVEKSICGKSEDDMVDLSLSPCLQDTFMCNTGQCIAHDRRCNLHNECEDASDELECQTILPDDGYHKDLPPTGQGGSSLQIRSDIKLSHVSDVDDLNMIVTLGFWVNLTWLDPRLTLMHLKASKSGTVLTKKEINSVWKPEYKLLNLANGKKELLEQLVFIRTNNNASETTYNDIYMDLRYPGSTNEISVIDHYTAQFTCDFEFFGYPFDVQRCSIEIQLASSYGSYVVFADNEASFKYSGVKHLNLYTVTDISGGVEDDGRRVVMEFSLERRPAVILLTTFLPSILLLLVSWSTLFIQLEQLNARATMSLTTLLILYTLFANVASALPTTAEIKLIDVWFSFIIFVLFSNILFHVFVREELTSVVTSVPQSFFAKNQTDKRKEAIRRLSCNLYVPLKILKVYRSIIVPIIILVFNIIFWVSVLHL